MSSLTSQTAFSQKLVQISEPNYDAETKNIEIRVINNKTFDEIQMGSRTTLPIGFVDYSTLQMIQSLKPMF